MKTVTPALVFLLLAVLLAVAVPVHPAVADVELNAQVRVRPELDHRAFDSNAATLQFTDMRTRLGIGAATGEHARVFVQFQDSRRFGARDAFGNPTSGTLNDAHNTDVHQAYLHVDRLFVDNLGLKAGRFEVNLGNQRVFGAVGWDNVGRSWDGLDLSYTHEKFIASAYWLKRLELNDPVENQDFDVYGVNVEIPDAGLEVFGFYEFDDNVIYAEPLVTDINQLDRIDVGAYFERAFDFDIDVEANAVYQTGTMGMVRGGDVDELDIAAFLLTAEVGYTLPTDTPARVAAGLDYASGDDDPADDDVNTYDNLYYTGHKFRGYMDYFLASNPAGLVDIMARGSVGNEWKGKLDVHLFMTAQDYTDFEGNDTSDVGFEVDLGVSTARVSGLDLSAGLGLFLPDDSFAGSADSDAGLWGYVMFTSNLRETLE